MNNRLNEPRKDLKIEQAIKRLANYELIIVRKDENGKEVIIG